MADEKRCETCLFYRVDEEYWHDHYLIPEHHYCVYNLYSRKKVEPNDCCENYQSEIKQ